MCQFSVCSLQLVSVGVAPIVQRHAYDHINLFFVHATLVSPASAVALQFVCRPPVFLCMAYFQGHVSETFCEVQNHLLQCFVRSCHNYDVFSVCHAWEAPFDQTGKKYSFLFSPTIVWSGVSAPCPPDHWAFRCSWWWHFLVPLVGAFSSF